MSACLSALSTIRIRIRLSVTGFHDFVRAGQWAYIHLTKKVLFGIFSIIKTSRHLNGYIDYMKQYVPDFQLSAKSSLLFCAFFFTFMANFFLITPYLVLTR